MIADFYSRRLLTLVLCAWIAMVPTASSQNLVESSAEARFQLDLQVPHAALMRLIPRGWTMDVRTQGAAKDANLRVIFIERMAVNGPEGRPVGDGSNLLVYLTAPVKDPEGASVQLVVGGITGDAADAPGPFGVYLPAKTHSLKRTTSSGPGPVIETQDWLFEAATGEYFKFNVTFERAVVNKRPPRERRYCSAKNPASCQIAKEQLMLDIVKNVTTNPPDRVQQYAFSAGGGAYADLFDGTERLLSWDNILWLNQEIFLPQE